MHGMNDVDKAECRPAVFLDRDGTAVRVSSARLTCGADGIHSIWEMSNEN
jgi:2-polyprenyl-6-methoxyphenol hydroxylase-like FAD-dependent oxidoreductase